MPYGWNTKYTLDVLCTEIKEVINLHLNDKKQIQSRAAIFQEKSIWPLWIFSSSILISLFLIVGLCVDDGTYQLDAWNILIIIVTLGITGLNIFLTLWITNKKQKHKVDRVNEICDDLQNLSKQERPLWQSELDYPSLYIPQSPDVHLQWTYRDGRLVALPVILLVHGDVILLRPGQTILVTCEVGEGNKARTYQIGDRYLPHSGEDFTSLVTEPVCHPPMLPQRAVVKVSPILSHLMIYLAPKSCKNRNPTVPMLYIDTGLRITLGFSLICFFLSLVISTLKYIMNIWPVTILDTDNVPSRLGVANVFFVPAQVLFSGLPLTLPLLWSLLQCYAIGHLFQVYHRSILIGEKLSSSMGSGVDQAESSRFDTPLQHAFNTLFQLIHDEFSLQSSFRENLLLTMGTVSTVCCVDKKGILSHSSATPEKIFFFRRRHRHHCSGMRSNRKRSEASLMPRDISHSFISNMPSAGKCSNIIRARSSSEYSTQVTLQGQASPVNQNIQFESNPVTLDISSNPRDIYMPEFSDPRWQRYATSLKPIGLNLLLNNCNTSILPRYLQFADHLTAVAANYQRTVAVVNHRCLCGLAQRIGFTAAATQSFNVESTLAIYRYNTAPPTYCLQDSLSAALKQTSLVHKSPLSNLFAAVAVEAGGGGYQFMSQGTADILADLCSDYWDGKDIVHMTEADKARIVDFYNRNIFSAYCVGLAYSPLLEKLRMENMDDILELAEDRLIKDHRLRNKPNDPKVERTYSAESMMSRFSLQSVQDADGYQRLLSNQIFLGMISMQYQAMADVVETIDRLEESCIRFVHFSKENQLRSRVFAERLGLESGWNCHISLSESESCLAGDPSNPPSTAHSQHLHTAATTTFDISLLASSACGDQRHPGGEEEDPEDRVPLLKRVMTRRAASPEDTQLCEEVDLVPQHYGSAPALYRDALKAMEDSTTSRMFGNSSPPSEPVNDTDEETPCIVISIPSVNDVEKSDALDGSQLDCEFSSTSSSTVSTEHPASQQRSEAIPSYFTTDKSKLPRGINSIRPHLEHIDNVPLQVSLFTDCTPPAVSEMISIMQEYGEVVCVLGSSLSVENTQLFVQGDCSIAVTPVLAMVCSRQKEDCAVPPEVPAFSPTAAPHLLPLELAAKISSLPCAINGRREDGFIVLTLINESRYLVHNLLLSLNFLLVCLCSLSLVQSVGSALLPSHLLSGRHLIWLQTLLVTALAAGVMGRRVERNRPAKSPPQKRVKLFTKKTCCRFAWASITRFLPSLFVCVATACVNMYQIATDAITTTTFQNSSGSENVTSLSLKDFLEVEMVVSEFACIQIGIYFIIISFSYANFGQKLGAFRFVSNPCWCIVAGVMITLQLLHIPVVWWAQPSIASRVSAVHVAVWSLAALWTIVLLGLNEFISNKERLSLAAEHRLAKLYFATKLGMYSPV